MDRDPKFEVQYLLTVTIAIVTFLATQRLGNLIDVWVGVSAIILLSIHIVLLNIIYLLDGVNSWEMKLVQDLRGYSRTTFQLITALIPFLLLHSLSLSVGRSLTTCNGPTIVNYLAGPWFHFCNGVIILIAYVLPLSITGVAMGKFRKNIVPGLTTFRDINFVVAPSEIEISSVFEDTEPLFVKVENEGSYLEKFDLDIGLPDGVEWKTAGEQGIDEYITGYNLDSDGAKRLNLKLRYRGDSRRTGVITVTLAHEDGTKSKTVDVYLNP